VPIARNRTETVTDAPAPIRGAASARRGHDRGTLLTGALLAVVAALAWAVLLARASGTTLAPPALRIAPPSWMRTFTPDDATRGPPTPCVDWARLPVSPEVLSPSGEPAACGESTPDQDAIPGPLAAIEVALRPPAWALASALAAWGLVVLAVVLPGLVPVLAAYGASHGTAPGARRTALHALLFALPAVGLWLLAGVLVLAGAAAVRAAAAGSPALTAWLPDALAPGLGAVALVRLSPLHEGALRASRRPAARWSGCAGPGWRGSLAAGWAHGTASLGVGAGLVAGLVLGAAALPWALAAAVLLFAERVLPRGERTARSAGGALAALALVAVAWPGPALAALQGTIAPPAWLAAAPDAVVPALPLLRTLEGHALDATAIAFSPDGGTLAAAGADGTVRLWETGTGRTGRVVRPDRRRSGAGADPLAVAVSRGGAVVALARLDGAVDAWDAATGRALREPPRRDRAASTIAFPPSGATVAVGYGDGAVVRWDLDRGEAIWALPPTGTTYATLALSPDGRTLAVGGWYAALAFSPDGRTVAVGGWYTPLTLRDAATGRERRTLASAAAVRALAFAPDGGLLAAIGDNEVMLWDTATGDAVVALPTPSTRAVAFAPDGATLTSAGFNGVLRSWEVATGRALGVSRVPESALVALAPRRMVVATVAGAAADAPDATVRAGVQLWDGLPGRR
jgi:predicted metal-binding membrane protein